MFLMRRVTPTLLLGFAVWMMVLLPSLPIQAGSDPGERLKHLKHEAKLELAEQTRWRERHTDLLSRQTAAEASLTRANEEYTRARRLRRRRGGSSEPAAEAVRKANEDIAAAAEALDEFFEQARREEIPPGWLRGDP